MTLLPLLLASTVAAAAPDAVILDFTAKWCGPCQQISPLVSRYIRQGYPIHKIDVDHHQDLVAQYQVKSIPCFILLVNGQEAGRVSGGNAKAQRAFQQLVARLPSPQNQQLAAAPRAQSQPRRVVEEAPRTFADEPPASPPRGGDAPRFEPPVENVVASVPRTPPSEARNNVARDFTRPVIRAKLDQDDSLPPPAQTVDPMASSVRIRVRDERGINFGSGTVVESLPGRSTVLTCGHVLRGLTDDSIVEVDVFRGARTETFVAEVVRFDLVSDVGLLAIPTETPLAVAEIASTGTREGEAVFSIGCGGGEPPSRMDGEVTALDKYLGPPTIECTGVPQLGRSGGGLFNGEGRIIGICSAANTDEQRGLYCGLKPIHDLLDAAKLSHLHRRPESEESAEIKLAAERDSGQVRQLAPTSERKEAASSDTPLAADLTEAEEIRRALANSDGAEIICIIRPVDNPEAGRRVVVINRASAKFLAYLNGEITAPAGLELAGAETPTGSAAAADASRDVERYRRTSQNE